MSVKILQRGMSQFQAQLSQGLEAAADLLYQEAYNRAPVETKRDPAFTRDRLHTDKSHSKEWPVAAVFVVTGSGDGFWVHEGTVDTPPHPFMSQALDAIRSQIPWLVGSKSRGREFGIHR